MADDGLTPVGAVKKGVLTFEQMIRGAAAGKLEISKKYRRADFEALLHQLEEMSDVAHPYEGIAFSEDIHLVQFQVPGTHIRYVTLMRGGQLILTKNTEGELDISNVLPGFNEHVVEAMASASMALGEDPKTRRKKAAKPKTPQKRKPSAYKPTKDKPGYVSDACINRFLAENARSLAYADLMGTLSKKAEKPIKGHDGLERVISDKDFLERAKRANLEIRVEPITSYLAKHRAEIKHRVKAIVGEITNKPEVREVAGTLVNEFAPEGDYEMAKLKELCALPDAAFDIYKKLSAERDKRKGNEIGECYVICFREIAMRKLAALFKSGKISEEDFETYRVTTRGWVGRAKAADEIKIDPYIQEEVIPTLKARGADEHVRDKIFDAVCEMGKRVIDPTHIYGAQHFRYLVDGLWMEGLMEKEVGGEVLPRTPGGALVEYTDGLGNLLENYRTYDMLLKTAFDRLLTKGSFDRKWRGLDTQIRCASFGRTLYAALLESERARFRRMKGEALPLKPDGTYLGRILRAYVGINKNHFAEAVVERRSHHAK